MAPGEAALHVREPRLIAHWIDDEAVAPAGAPVLPVCDPARGETIASVVRGDAALVSMAAKTARAALPEWARVPPRAARASAVPFQAVARATKGFRPGAPNRPVNPTPCVQAALAALGLDRAPAAYAGDAVWNYELGTKAVFLNRRASVNLALFRMDWEGIQQVTPLTGCGFSFISNSGGAKNEGAELEFQLRPMPQLTLSGGLAYNDARLTEPAPTLGGADHPIQNTPKLTYQLAAEYSAPLPKGARLATRLDYSHRDEVFRNFIPTSFDYYGEGYESSSVRIDYLPVEGGWSLGLLVTNLTDEQPILSAEQSRPRAPAPNRYGRYQTLTPRTVYLEFTKRF